MTVPVETLSVVTANGLKGTVPTAFATDEHPGLVRVSLETGRDLWVGREMLVRQPEGHYLLPLAVPTGAAEQSESVVVPVIEEEAVVEKRAVATGGVRVTKQVHAREEQVATTSLVEELDVQREPAGQFVDQPEPARMEGDRTIIPIYEEVIVVEKRLRLKERWVITKRRVETPSTQSVTLRREEAVIEQLKPDGGADNPPPTAG